MGFPPTYTTLLIDLYAMPLQDWILLHSEIITLTPLLSDAQLPLDAVKVHSTVIQM